MSSLMVRPGRDDRESSAQTSRCDYIYSKFLRSHWHGYQFEILTAEIESSRISWVWMGSSRCVPDPRPDDRSHQSGKSIPPPNLVSAFCHPLETGNIDLNDTLKQLLFDVSHHARYLHAVKKTHSFTDPPRIVGIVVLRRGRRGRVHRTAHC